MNKLTYVTIAVFIAGIAVATGIGYFSYKGVEDTPSAPSFEDFTESKLNELDFEKTTLPSRSSLRVENQSPGLQVHISSLTLAKDHWVVIHEDKNGSPGTLLGAGRFRAGMTSGDVELLRATEEGGTYYAMLHIDDGIAGFNLRDDVPLIDEKGNMTMSAFIIKTLIDVQVQ